MYSVCEELLALMFRCAKEWVGTFRWLEIKTIERSAVFFGRSFTEKKFH